MTFFKKRDESRSRRGLRLRWLQIRRIAVFAGFFALAAGAGLTACYSDFLKKSQTLLSARALEMTAEAGFRVREILVTGRTQIPAQELLQTLSIRENAPILGVNIAEAQKSVAGLPWVEQVSVARRLPDKLVVELKERSPAALWQYRKKITLIDRSGAVLPTDRLESWQHLPLVVGEDAPRHVAEFLDLLAAEPQIAAELSAAVRVRGGRWDLRLRNGIAVKLPEEDAGLALRRLAMGAEKERALAREVAIIDLRLPDRMTVTPVAGHEAAAKDDAAQKSKGNI